MLRPLLLLACLSATTAQEATLLPNASVSPHTPPSYTRLPDAAEPCCKPRPATWSGMLTLGGTPAHSLTLTLTLTLTLAPALAPTLTPTLTLTYPKP